MLLGGKRENPAVVGVGTTTFGSLPDYDATALGIWALTEAVQDCGLSFKDIDGMVVHRITDYQKLCETTGINPRFISVQPSSGRMSGVSIQIGAMAILAGKASAVALIYGNDGRSAGAKYGGSADRYGTSADQFWFPYGMTSPGAVNALLFQRHMALYGTTSEDLGHIAVAFRKHAMLNPGAVMRKPISVADHQASRFICAPLHILDYCLINDGGVAMILTSAERAKDFKKPPVYLRGFAQSSRLADGTVPEDFGHAPMQLVAKDVYQEADIAQRDLSGLMIYDNFSPSVLFSLEGFGFCPVGESGRWVRDGHLSLDGDLPINTSGGHLSESYMQGWALNVEAVRQLRGECGERQIKDARLIQYIAGGPMTTTMIYGRDPT
jgi:acetyl-CoA acetyltransferase